MIWFISVYQYIMGKGIKYGISVLNQTYTNWIGVIDDGSVSGSVKLLEHLMIHDRLIQWKNKGLLHVWMIASLAKGRLFAHGCRWHYASAENRNSVETLRNNDFIDVLGSNADTIDESNVVKGLANYKPLNEILICKIYSSNDYVKRNGLFEMNMNWCLRDRMQSFGFAHMRLVNLFIGRSSSFLSRGGRRILSKIF